MLDGIERTETGERLSQLDELASAILERWTAAGERHERAVNQLESQLTAFEATSARLQRDTSQRMQELEQAVHHEWAALRGIHEEPVRHLREQANSLTEVCIATAHTAQRGFDRAEARLAAIELGLQQRITELHREIQTVLGEVRANPSVGGVAVSPPSWPLDGVTRLHHQLRQGLEPAVDVPPGDSPSDQFHPEPVAESPVAEPQGAPVVESPVAPPRSAPIVEAPVLAREPVSPPRVQPAVPTPINAEIAGRLRVLERALDERDAETRQAAAQTARATAVSRMAVIGLGLVVVLTAGFAFWMQNQVRVRVEDADRRSREATDVAARETAATREQAAREIASARELASRAQVVSAVLAAPDLVRFSLVSTDQGSAGSAQALWSLTRGFVLSGSRLSPVPEGKSYQVWLLARGQAVNVGTLTPDDTGSATLAVAAPSTTLPVFSVVVSLEPTGGSARPDGPPVLVRSRVLP